jgi:hypothetical protein
MKTWLIPARDMMPISTTVASAYSVYHITISPTFTEYLKFLGPVSVSWMSRARIIDHKPISIERRVRSACFDLFTNNNASGTLLIWFYITPALLNQVTEFH